MFRNSSEGSGKEEEVTGWLCTLWSVSAVYSSRIVMVSLSAQDSGAVNHDEKVDKALYRWLADTSQFPVLDLVADFNWLDVCWKLKTEERRKSRRFLEFVEFPVTAGKGAYQG